MIYVSNELLCFCRFHAAVDGGINHETGRRCQLLLLPFAHQTQHAQVSVDLILSVKGELFEYFFGSAFANPKPYTFEAPASFSFADEDRLKFGV